ncbi:hypothetical protein CH373_06225 [Leptospira perolatii]|uniref:Lipoprotein n=1 Tax=Leptospira perolatii TaxID=2023191 RepID=A0A2M9ZNW5_9LEPT|nr:hypothetical protein [Leptospira perolatii]PJZ70861.1 hypothetical protein CH360_04955 [Leptospira perolatii]PJZ73757.1 hypothetical protein CH373_06225 [Leptospira perolatii]
MENKLSKYCIAILLIGGVIGVSACKTLPIDYDRVENPNCIAYYRQYSKYRRSFPYTFLPTGIGFFGAMATDIGALYLGSAITVVLIGVNSASIFYYQSKLLESGCPLIE